MSASATPTTTLKLEHHKLFGGTLIRISGAIDETFDKERLIAGVSGVVLIDLDGVLRITSSGVREWIAGLKRIPHDWLGFARARPAMVSQFNMVTKFAADGQLLSLYLPYVCPQSGKTFEVLADLRTQHAQLAAFAPPAASCPDSGTPAEFDDVPRSYLSFVASRPPPTPPPLVDQLLSGQVDRSSLKITKEVQGSVTGLWLSGRLDEQGTFKRLADGLEGTLYVSCGEVSALTNEGVAKLLKFLREVQVPVVLGELPLDLGAHVVADAELKKSVTLSSVSLEVSCPEHGPVRATVDATALGGASDGAPPQLFCNICRKLCTPGFDTGQLIQTTTLRLEPASDGIQTLIATHHAQHADATPTAPALTNLAGASGALVLGRYQIQRAVGAGGMAEVFLAKQVGVGGFDRPVVIKRILPGLAVDPTFVEMFLTEARLAARLSHPNVVQIFDVGQESGQHFIAMELVRGWDLNAVLRASVKAQRPFPPWLAARVAAEVARGLGAAHLHQDDDGKPRPIVHRDVSPHNVLVSADGHVKITDFGIAKAADTASLTPSSQLKGKAAYMAPELIRDSKSPPDPRLDLFALGLVFYQLLTLKHPFRRDTDAATFAALLHDAVPAPSSLVGGLDPRVDEIVARAVEKDPKRRYATARDFENDLEDLIRALGRPASAGELSAFLSTLRELGPPVEREPQSPTSSPTRAEGKRAPIVGRTLGGEFVVRELIGSGGYGEVYLADQRSLDRQVVVKLLHASFNARAEMAARFLREAQLASRLDHPYAAHVYAFGAEDDGRLWIAMEWVRGTPLAALLEKGPIPLPRLLPFVEHICEVVQTAHQAGIVHRDLKAANVMVITRAGRLLPKLLDFGIAKLDPLEPRTPGKRLTSLTHDGQLIGSPQYMAPEQWRDPTDADARSDQYALAVLTYRALTGRFPLAGETLVELAAAHATGVVRALGPGFPDGLDAVFARALAKRPDDRFGSVLELAHALRLAAGTVDAGSPLPQLDEPVRESAIATAPQPIADAVAALEASHTAGDALEATGRLARACLRWAGVLALSCWRRVGPAAPVEVTRLLAELRKGTLDDAGWLELLGQLVAPFEDRRELCPVPELVDALTGPDGELDDLFATVQRAAKTPARDEAHAVELLEHALQRVGWLLTAMSPLFAYPLVVGRGGVAESWSGVRRSPRRPVPAQRSLPDDRPVLLDAAGAVAVELWPLAQVMSPAPGAPAELFLLDGEGAQGARLRSHPDGLERLDAGLWRAFELEGSLTAPGSAKRGESI